MNTIKPSELPGWSVISQRHKGLWIKDAYLWTAIIQTGPGKYVSDSGFGVLTSPEHVGVPADMYFDDYTLVSLPVGWDIHHGNLVKRQDV